LKYTCVRAHRAYIARKVSRKLHVLTSKPTKSVQCIRDAIVWSLETMHDKFDFRQPSPALSHESIRLHNTISTMWQLLMLERITWIFLYDWVGVVIGNEPVRLWVIWHTIGVIHWTFLELSTYFKIFFYLILSR